MADKLEGLLGPNIAYQYKLATQDFTAMSHDRCMRLLMMRLRVPEGHIFPLPHVSLYVNSKKAYVFGVNKNEEPFTLEDDPELFPSDLLITQLRLIIG